MSADNPYGKVKFTWRTAYPGARDYLEEFDDEIKKAIANGFGRGVGYRRDVQLRADGRSVEATVWLRHPTDYDVIQDNIEHIIENKFADVGVGEDNVFRVLPMYGKGGLDGFAKDWLEDIDIEIYEKQRDMFGWCDRCGRKCR